MHERAKLVGGKLAVFNRLDSGTEAELTIPASVAYAKSPVARRSMASNRQSVASPVASARISAFRQKAGTATFDKMHAVKHLAMAMNVR